MADEEDDYPSSGIGKGSALARADVEEYQLYKLKKMLAYVYEKSSFYKDLFSRHGVTPKEVTSLIHLERIPFTQPSELAASPERFCCVSMGDIARVTTFTTSGSTGPEKRVFCTAEDIERMTEYMGAGIRTVAEKGDVVDIMLPSGSVNNQADLLARGVEKMGGVPLKAGMNISADEHIRLIKRHKPAVLFGVASRLYRMTQELKDREPLDELGVRALFLTSGYLSETQREHLRTVWNADIHTHYGLTEMGLGVAVECHAHDGYHFNEADLLLEIIDPSTGEKVSEGEGELVFTTLTREGTPLIRYRTHDIALLINGPCPCGADTLTRFGKVTRRLESPVKIGDDSRIYPSLFDDVLYALPEVIDFDVRVRRSDGRDLLSFLVEVTEAPDGLDRQIFRILTGQTCIAACIASGSLAEPEIRIVGRGALSRSGRAKKKIIDERG